jgi:lipopolysaccharide/colanic/teichoic acid biosynthesis glycosyltransferase
MTSLKRQFDIVVAALLGFLLLPVVFTVVVIILIRDGRPVFYVSERMKTPERGFDLVKFRTMRPDLDDAGATGAHKNNRVTATGALLRKYRLDEMPQLWNILKGDMSFVGPRPPLRRYVEKFPEIYGRVLRSRPGLTGLASIYYHQHEEWLLRNAKSSEETEKIYCRACVPRKARLDLIYQKRRNLCFDVLLMLRTVFRRLR